MILEVFFFLRLTTYSEAITMCTRWNFVQFVQVSCIIFELMAYVRCAPLLPNQQMLFDRLVHEYFTLLSPCPQVFEYRYDQNGVHGIISARVPSSVYNSFVARRMDIVAFFRVSGRITDNRNSGTIGLLHALPTTAKMIEMHQPVQYRVDFPHHPTTPSVENITVNGQLICMNDRPLKTLYTSNRFHFGLKLLPRPSMVSPSNPKTTDIPETIENNVLREEAFHPTSPRKHDCGKIDHEFRLTHSKGDGEEIARGTWPWLVAIFVKTADGSLGFKCSGNLLSNRIVVSAAHCFNRNNERVKPSDVLLSFGRHDLLDWTEKSMRFWNVKHIEVPDDESLHGNSSDIAVLVTQEFIEYNAVVKPICLWPPETSHIRNENLTGVIVGWTKPKEDEGKFMVPRQFKMQIMPKTVCSSDTVICAESEGINEPEASSNSGNGFAIWQNESWFLKGIVSMNVSDHHRNRFILTDIGKTNAWILKWIKIFL